MPFGVTSEDDDTNRVSHFFFLTSIFFWLRGPVFLFLNRFPHELDSNVRAPSSWTAAIAKIMATSAAILSMVFVMIILVPSRCRTDPLVSNVGSCLPVIHTRMRGRPPSS